MLVQYEIIESELDTEALSKIEQITICFEIDDPPTLDQRCKALKSAKTLRKLKLQKTRKHQLNSGRF